jgi:hypothetical protein
MKNLRLRLCHPLMLPAVVLLLAALAVALPPMRQAAHYHDFADQRALFGLPHAMDVLSNLAFAVMGLALWRRTQRGDGSHPPASAMLRLLALGLWVTAAGSAWYHLHPSDAGLLVDRASMSVAFAGLLGVAGSRAGRRAGQALAAGVLFAAPLALGVWAADGNLVPWSVLQGGGVLLLVLLAARPAAYALPVRWGHVVVLYALAKLFELGDHAVWVFTHGLLAGHAIKHLLAAAAIGPVLAAMARSPRPDHNRRARVAAA